MKRVFALALMFALVVGNLSSLSAQAPAIGVISGTVSGPSGPLAGVTVNVLSSAGNIIGSAVTTTTGSFSVGGMASGTFSVQAIGATGSVLSTSAATLTAASMTATVSMSATAATLAAAATAAVATTTAAVGGAITGISTAAIVAGVGAAAATAGVVAAVATKSDASPSR
jgi:hypothetical protein